MNEFESANLETPVEDHELQELVSRLSRDRDNRTRVHDIAETMDIEPALVIAALNDMRRQRMSVAVTPPRESKLIKGVPRKFVLSAVAVISLFAFVASIESTKSRTPRGILVHELRPKKDSAIDTARRVFNSDGPTER